jgi:imidazolonepropionase-like amidohydrolase
MKKYGIGILVALVWMSGMAFAADVPDVTLFKNVKVFNGVDEQLQDLDVLVVGNMIKKVGKDLPVSGTYEIDVATTTYKRMEGDEGFNAFGGFGGYTVEVIDEAGEIQKVEVPVNVIDGGGRTLMPGLIEGHGHLQMNGASLTEIENHLIWEELAIRSSAMARYALMSGITSWRDAGGMAAGLQNSIDSGFVIGPRIYPSGGFIGPTGSHADFRNRTAPNETINGPQCAAARLGMTFTADGVDAIKTAARQNFMQGATQIKIMSSGGVASEFDPWQLDAYSAEEISAAVEVADAYGTYVMSHAYSKKSIMRCLENGVKTIEHGFMFDEEIADLMKEKGAYWTLNVQAFSPELSKVSAIAASENASRKADSAQLAFKDCVENVKKYRPKLGFNNDFVGGTSDGYYKQNDHQIWLGANLFGNHYWLQALTSVNGEILKLCGPVLDPYPDGKLGVIEEGAYADILLVDGNPLEDITVIGGSEKWFDAPVRDGIDTMHLIMKDGKIYKNTL